MTNINGRQQEESYWCNLCRERFSFISSSSSLCLLCPHCNSHLLGEIESPTINTYPDLFSNSEDLYTENPVFYPEDDEEEEEEEDNGRRQYTCFQCNVTTTHISSSSSPLLLCPHCHAEFWEELDSLPPSPSTTYHPNSNSTFHIDDVPDAEDKDRYGNSSTVAVIEKMPENGWQTVIFHKVQRMLGLPSEETHCM